MNDFGERRNNYPGEVDEITREDCVDFGCLDVEVRAQVLTTMRNGLHGRLLRAAVVPGPVPNRHESGILTVPIAQEITYGEWLLARQQGLLIVFYRGDKDLAGEFFSPPDGGTPENPVDAFDPASHMDRRMPNKETITHARVIKLSKEFGLGDRIEPDSHEEHLQRVKKKNLGFQARNADAMTMMVHDKRTGEWMDSPITLPLMELKVHPLMQALHYGSALFEGMACEFNEQGEVCVYGIEDHYNRMKKGADRFRMPMVSLKAFTDAVISAIKANARFIPEFGKGRLYIRPNLFSAGPKLRVGNSDLTALVITTAPIGNASAYFGSVDAPVVFGIPTDRVRAMPGQAGDIKAAGNYAPTIEAIERMAEMGLKGVAYMNKLDPTGDADDREFRETNASNLIAFKSLGKGRWKLKTPPLDSGDILEGRTRALVLELAKARGWEVEQGPITESDIASGEYEVMAGCGTAAYLTPIHGFQKVNIENGTAEGDPIMMLGANVKKKSELYPKPLRLLMGDMEKAKRGNKEKFNGKVTRVLLKAA